ncbi:MAG: FIST N-terminal domain-containing protein [Verrucomicrobiia bacterium]
MKTIRVAAMVLAFCCVSVWAADDALVFKTAAASGENAAEAGKKAATELKAAFGGTAPKAVLVMDSFEDVAAKKAMLDGVASVLPKEILFGGASYGGFTQRGSVNDDGVVLLGIGGDGIGVEAALAEKMGAAGLTMEKDLEKLTATLNRAGEQLAKQLPLDRGALMLLISDAHSPKNQLLLDGVQKVAGKKLPITGGSVNKNAGQNWVYFRGAAHTDSAIALLLTGSFKVTQTGRQAKTNEAVIETAREGSASVLKSAPAKPFAVLAFNCGGRKGKLKRLEDELEAIQTSLGKELPLFGTYCAGEYGPADISESKGDCTPCGRGWHVMFTVLTR